MRIRNVDAMCKCDCCGKVFSEFDASHYRESWGEVFSCCPFCGGDYYEIEVCANCGAELSEDFLDDVCPECGEVIYCVR